MRIRNRLALGASLGVIAGGLAITACGGDDSTAPPGTTDDGGVDASVDATRADTGTGTDSAADTGMTGDTGTTPDGGAHDTGTGGDGSMDGSADGATDAGTTPTNVLYLMSNDPTSGSNAVYGYHRGADGSLTPIAGGPFPTGGTGIGNPQQMLGPEDSDYQLVASADHKYLFAANGGSDNVSVFATHADGTLTAVTGSPFPSGGFAPVSLYAAGSYLLVTNQDRDLARPLQTGALANYATLSIAADGSLSPAVGVLVQPAGVAAQMLLPTPDNTAVFGAEFTFSAASATPGLRSFTLGANGALTRTSGDPYSLPADDGGPDGGTEADQLILGLAINPVNKVLYVNFLVRSEVSAYAYDDTGSLVFHGSAKVSGAAPCWIRVSKDGKFVYTTDTATDQVSVLSASADGLTLKEIQVLSLAGPGPLLDSGPNMGHTSSEAYDEELSPDGKFLYVESERLTFDPAYTAGNMVHVLAVDPATGMLTESVTATPTDVDAGTMSARSEGLVVF